MNESESNQSFSSIEAGIELDTKDEALKIFLRNIQAAEDFIRAHPSAEAADEIMDTINRRLVMTRMYGQPVCISGNLWTRDISPDVIQDTYDASLLNIGADSDTVLAYVDNQHFLLGGFRLDKDDDYDGDLRIVGTLINPDDTQLSMLYYPDQLTGYTFETPSMQQALKYLPLRHPDLAAHLATTPQTIEQFDTLRNFTMSIDWSTMPECDDEQKQRLIEMCNLYLSDHVTCTAQLYRVTAVDQLTIYETGPDGEVEDSRVISLDEPATIYGPIAGLTFKLIDDDNGQERYGVSVHVTASDLNFYQIPVESIEAIESFNTTALGRTSISAANNQLIHDYVVEIPEPTYNPETMSSDEETRAALIEKGRQIEEKLQEAEQLVADTIKQYSEQNALYYASSADVIRQEARQRAGFDAIINYLSQLDTTLEFSGGGIYHTNQPSVEMDAESNAVTLNYGPIAQRDMYETVTGKIVNGMLAQRQDEDGHQLIRNLIVQPLRGQGDFSEPTTRQLGYAQLFTRNNLLVQPGAELSVTVPALDRITTARQVIESLDVPASTKESMTEFLYIATAMREEEHFYSYPIDELTSMVNVADSHSKSSLTKIGDFIRDTLDGSAITVRSLLSHDQAFSLTKMGTVLGHVQDVKVDSEGYIVLTIEYGEAYCHTRLDDIQSLQL